MANVFQSYDAKKKGSRVSSESDIKRFGGKTIGQIGQEFKINPDSVEFFDRKWTNPQGDEIELTSLVMVIGGDKKVFPFSTGLKDLYDAEELTVEVLLDCEVRVSQKFKGTLGPSGEKIYDGETIVTLGKPSGDILNGGTTTKVFEEVTEEEGK